MFEEAHFTGNYGFDRFVLVAWPRKPWAPPGQRYEEVPRFRALQLVFEATTDSYGNTNWHLLHLLRISEHPRNMHPGELRDLVAARLDGVPRRVLYRKIRPHLRLDDDVSAPEPASQSSDLTMPASFVEVELLWDSGEPISNLGCELVVANGDVRALITDRNGRRRQEKIPNGPCRIRLPQANAKGWRGPRT